jgi:signal-transduction protein with cAMP-binding, CBS, and nucleotidyltransferase domain
LAIVDHRDERMFPKLTPEEIDRIRHFGEIRHYAKGESLVVTGEIAPGLFVLVRGKVRVPVTIPSVISRRSSTWMPERSSERSDSSRAALSWST